MHFDLIMAFDIQMRRGEVMKTRINLLCNLLKANPLEAFMGVFIGEKVIGVDQLPYSYSQKKSIF